MPAANRIDREECRRLRALGMSYADLGRHFGVTRQGARRACLDVGSSANNNPLIALEHARACREEAAKDLRRQIHDLFLSGDNAKTIAWKLGKTSSTVYRHLPPSQSKTGLKFRAANLEARACR